MKNEQHAVFQQAKEWAKIKLFLLLLIQGYFQWYEAFLMDFFCNFLKSFALSIKFWTIRYQI